ILFRCNSKLLEESRPLKQVKQVLQILPKPGFSSCYRGGFEHKMTKQEADLIVGARPKARWIMVLNHPDKGAKHLLKIMLKNELVIKSEVLLV
uniref:Uncharacterized protein n=1 Tax=Phasianus colchicus TaxID=9054 RepID=A0A669QSC4_PHACC